MSNYYLDGKRYKITYGYDYGLKSFSLIIHFECAEIGVKNQLVDDFIFNSMRDWPQGRMTINDVKYVLEKFGERIPEDDLYQLYLEAKNDGYLAVLDIEDFKYAVRHHRFVIQKGKWMGGFRKLLGAFYVHFKGGVRTLGRLYPP